MKKYLVNVTIENKPYVNDPEGETILKDLIAGRDYQSVKSVRTAKILNIIIETNDRKEAEDIVKKLCDELRIYNPVVSNCKVEVVDIVQVKN